MRKFVTLIIALVMTMSVAIADVNLRKVLGNLEFYDTDTNEVVIYNIDDIGNWMTEYSRLLDKVKELNVTSIKCLNKWEDDKVRIQNMSKAEYKLALENCGDNEKAREYIKAARNNTSCSVVKNFKEIRDYSAKETKRIQKQLVLVHDYLEQNF